jgi:TRAP-type C4-dicarboxylate transport system permease small subunit
MLEQSGVLDRLNRILTYSAQTISNILLSLIMLTVFIEVVSRYLFERSHGFMEEFSKWSQIWIAYLMVGIIERTRSHIKVDILYNRLSPLKQIYLMMIFDMTTLVFAALLFFSGTEAASNLYRLGYKATSGVPVPMWIVMLAAPIGAVLLAFFGLSNLIDDLRSLRQHK